MANYYTGRGDDGTTSIPGKGRIKKSDILVRAIGSVDELNSCISLAGFHIRDKTVKEELRAIQNDLFIIGAELGSAGKTGKPIGTEPVNRLENAISQLGSRIPRLTQFVIPGGSEGSIYLHLSRTVARRAEREIIAALESGNCIADSSITKYMNRLSSFLFVAALHLNQSEGIKEEHPTY